MYIYNANNCFIHFFLLIYILFCVEGHFYIYFVEIISRVTHNGENVMTDVYCSYIIEMSHIGIDSVTVIFKFQRERVKKQHEV